MSLSLAILASGKGSNCRAILEAARCGRLDARVVMVLTNNPEAGVLDIAKEYDVPVFAKSHRDFPSREAFDEQLLAALSDAGADSIALAGYMRLLTSAFVRAFEGRMLNIHPALLPSFPGADGGGDALAYGVRLAGCTVHFVEDRMDHGPVVIQAAVPVGSEDTMASLMPRIHAMEHIILPQALQWLAEGRLKIEGRKVALLCKERRSALPARAQVGENRLGPYIISPPPDAMP